MMAHHSVANLTRISQKDFVRSVLTKNINLVVLVKLVTNEYAIKVIVLDTYYIIDNEEFIDLVCMISYLSIKKSRFWSDNLSMLLKKYTEMIKLKESDRCFGLVN